MEKTKYLVLVSPDKNNNKFYRMIPHGNVFTVEYGRVGAQGIKKTYPINLFYAKYSEKVGKGYKDMSDLHTDKAEVIDDEYAPLKDSSVSMFVNTLRQWARDIVASSYTIKASAVTPFMLRQAQISINELIAIKDVETFNEELCELFQTLPRAMTKVADFLATTKEDFKEIIEREQSLLDVMSSQVNDVTVSKQEKGNDKTILEAFGLNIVPCSQTEINEIKKHLGKESAHKFVRAFKVINLKTEENFKKYCKERNIKKCDYLYHGSRNENIWGIITRGMLLNPNAITTGKMFGYGLYYANRAQKSINYTSSGCRVRNDNTGILAIFKVATGNPFHVHAWDRKYLQFKEQDIRKGGYDSLYAHKGVDLINDEIIVYNEAAVSLRYLVEVK